MTNLFFTVIFVLQTSQNFSVVFDLVTVAATIFISFFMQFSFSCVFCHNFMCMIPAFCVLQSSTYLSIFVLHFLITADLDIHSHESHVSGTKPLFNIIPNQLSQIVTRMVSRIFENFLMMLSQCVVVNNVVSFPLFAFNLYHPTQLYGGL